MAYTVTAKDSPQTVGTTNAAPSLAVASLKSTRVVVAWREVTTNDGFVQCYSMNATTGVMAAESSALEFDTTAANNISICTIDSTHFIMFWVQSATLSLARIYSVNDGTGAITAMGAGATTISAGNLRGFESVLLDSTHVCFAYGDLTTGVRDVYCATCSVNTTTGAISVLSTATVNSTFYTVTLGLSKISSEKVLVVYTDGLTTLDGYGQVMAINNSTWAVTSAGSELEFADADGNYLTSAIFSTGSPTWAFVKYRTANTYYAQALSINTSTWAITEYTATELASQYITDENPANHNSSLRVNDTAVLLFYTGASNDGYVGVFELNTGDGTLTESGTLEFDTVGGSGITACDMTGGFYVAAWADTTNSVYEIQAFTVGLASAIKTVNGLAKASVKTVNGLAIASVKTINGLA